ncbi:MAG: glycosyltransferase family 39 protein [bacterium]|nr:glycosyltransferase family 39 protein [bacterium]
MPEFFSNFPKLSIRTILFILFILAVVIRFLYFPENIYFGFDQARDAFESQNIYKNFDIKIVGPPTASPDLFHGPLYWYLIGPIYFLGGGDPAFPAGFIRIYNAVGVFLIFWIGKTLFNRKVGLIASLLYAFSFEQTQYAIYFHHPPLAVLTIMLFYGGLSLAIFKKDWRGIALSLLGYGLSIQAEFQLPYLGIVFIFLFLVFRKTLLPLLKPRTILVSTFCFLVPISTFILAEFKFGARTTKGILGMLAQAGRKGDLTSALGIYFKRLVLQIHDNLFAFWDFAPAILVLFLGTALFFVLRKKDDHRKILFLLIWALSTSILTIFGPMSLYYTNVGISPGVLLLASFFIVKIPRRISWITPIVLVLIILSNLSLIKERNPQGVISDIQVQEGMLLDREKRGVDYIYEQSNGKPIVVSALTMPLQVNTTWAYLFNWYGKAKYGYLPYWGNVHSAEGYPGYLPPWQSQEKEYAAFSIIEPTRGVRQPFIDQFLVEQEQYGGVVEEKTFGDKLYSQFVVQRRESRKAQ